MKLTEGCIMEAEMLYMYVLSGSGCLVCNIVHIRSKFKGQWSKELLQWVVTL